MADENLHVAIVRGLRRRSETVDIVSIQEIGMTGVDDPSILAWAAEQQRILLTHDVETITKYAYERVRSGQKMTGVFEIHRSLPFGVVIEELLLLAETSLEGEWEGQVRYLPLL